MPTLRSAAADNVLGNLHAVIDNDDIRSQHIDAFALNAARLGKYDIRECAQFVYFLIDLFWRVIKLFVSEICANLFMYKFLNLTDLWQQVCKCLLIYQIYAPALSSKCFSPTLPVPDTH